jgi:holo-[acyl-carrier protein] synthase
MIVGVGLDIVAIGRWSRALTRIQDQIFTPQELAACAQRVDRVDALAARFAAKEACLKALGAGIDQGALRQIEIVSDAGGAPRIRLRGGLTTRAREAGVRRAHVSLSHQEGFAAAVVILEGPRKRAPSARRPEDSAVLALETMLRGIW